MAEQSPAGQYEGRRIDQAIFTLMLEDPEKAWSIEELCAEIGDEAAVSGSLERLRTFGLIDPGGQAPIVLTCAALRAADLLD